jgi:chitinase
VAVLDSAAGYIALVNRLRELMARDNPSKTYIISGAPQCSLPEPNMGDLITGAKFDLLWIQFYNTPSCSAREYFTPVPGGHFNFDQWVTFVNSGKSAGAKLYAGLLADPTDSSAWPGHFLQPKEAKELISDLQETYSEVFGGVMLWEATGALRNDVSYLPGVPAAWGNNVTYYEAVKYYLKNETTLPTST